MSEHVIGRARFVDGTTQPIYLDRERQYVLDEGERVYGLFILPEEDRCDAPVIATVRAFGKNEVRDPRTSDR